MNIFEFLSLISRDQPSRIEYSQTVLPLHRNPRAYQRPRYREEGSHIRSFRFPHKFNDIFPNKNVVDMKTSRISLDMELSGKIWNSPGNFPTLKETRSVAALRNKYRRGTRLGGWYG